MQWQFQANSDEGNRKCAENSGFSTFLRDHKTFFRSVSKIVFFKLNMFTDRPNNTYYFFVVSFCTKKSVDLPQKRNWEIFKSNNLKIYGEITKQTSPVSPEWKPCEIWQRYQWNIH